MGKRRKKKEELPLFDLPLQKDSESSQDEVVEEVVVQTEPEEVSQAPIQKQTSLFEVSDEESSDEDLGPDDETEVEVSGDEEAAPFFDRLLAGFADLMVHATMLGVAAGATVALGVPLRLELWPSFAVLGFVLSFLYWTVPLAFWGQTPGMAWIGNSARSVDDEPLSFGQAVLRWVGALTTVAFAGLPVLLSLGGRSLTDRMSDSKTVTL